MNEPVFEMLWDCSSCGTTGLLGKSQRRCPNCGAPQDPTKRYFPRPGEAVAVQGHAFVGADWSCAACSTPNGAAASFCANCGNPKDGNAAVATKADRIVKDGVVVEPARAQASQASQASSSSPVLRLVLAGAAFVVVVVIVLFLWKKDATVDVVAHRWTREVDVERFEAVRDDAWCSSMPSGAYNVTRHREVRTTKKIPDGEDCHDRNVDKGDGTFTVKKECTTKYRDEPVYDDKCAFDVDRWHVVRSAKAQGATTPAPSWPDPQLASSSSGRGAERAGAHREDYVVQLRDAGSGKTHECSFAEDRWRALTDGSRHKMKIRMTGGAVCDSLH